jgi:hypothetical protein
MLFNENIIHSLGRNTKHIRLHPFLFERWKAATDQSSQWLEFNYISERLRLHTESPVEAVWLKHNQFL